MTDKKSVIAHRCVETTTPGVKVNMFEAIGGYVVPVTFGGKATTATVQIRNILLLDEFKATAIYPGQSTPVPVPAEFKDEVLELKVPLKRGCAMVKLEHDASPKEGETISTH